MMRNIQKPIANLLIVCIFHNSIAAFYLLTLATFFVPFPAFADAFLDKAAEGEALGGTLMNGFTVPNVNSSTGQITLTNGSVAGQTIEQNAMFQEIQAGSIDAAAAAYGDAAAQGTYVNNNIDSLKTGGTQHAYAYQTLMGANTAMPNMLNDPMWKQSDDVFTRTSPLINDMFNGCTKTTNWGETSCPIHIEDLKQCKKSLKTEKCTVTRALTYEPVMGFASGDGNIESCGKGCNYLNVGIVGNNYWEGNCDEFQWNVSFRVLRPEAIKKVTIYNVKYDDETRIWLNGNLVYTGQSGWGGCEHGTSWDEYPNKDITNVFKSTAAGGIVSLLQKTRVDGNGEGYSRIKIEADPDIKEEFIDTPSGCRQRLFDAWPLQGTAPTFVSSGSLDDQASTDWWQCTEASRSKVVGIATIKPGNYTDYITGADILPDAPEVPPAPICYKAETRTPGIISLECYTDYQGYQVCPQYNYDTNAHNTCDSLSSCAYVKEECAKDAAGNELIDPVTGSCKDFIVTYDCGTDSDAKCDLTNNGENTICDAEIRCMGGECVDPQQESNEDFLKAATALQTLNESQKQLSCDPLSGACKFFAGETYTCQMASVPVLGSVDCCNMPIGGSWIDYIWLAKNTWEQADTSVEIAAFGLSQAGTGLTGAWQVVSSGTVFEAPVNLIADSYSAITDTFTSMYDSVASMLGEEIGVDLGIEAIEQQAVQWLGEWIASTFGETAASTLLTATAGTGAAAGTTAYSAAGSLLSSIVTVVGIIYAIYQIAKLVVQLVFACTEEEIKLQMYRNQKMCTKPDEIGTYCSARGIGCIAHKQVYCCFSSPFARIFQEEARKQMGMDFGKPLEPNCGGLTIEQIGGLDFDKMDFGEWINMLKVANVMPLDGAKADELYSTQMSTIGNLPGTQNQSVIDRINNQTQGSDIDAQRQYLLDNM